LHISREIDETSVKTSSTLIYALLLSSGSLRAAAPKPFGLQADRGELQRSPREKKKRERERGGEPLGKQLATQVVEGTLAGGWRAGKGVR